MTRLAEIATLAHGYTMADVDSFARIAVSITRSKISRWVSEDDRHFDAWHAVVDRLYDTETHGPAKPERSELISIACQSILDAQTQERQAHGRNNARSEVGPRFAVYWGMEEGSDRAPRMIRGGGRHGDEDFTERLVERMALPVALGALTDGEYEVIATLAAHDTSKAAAEAMGLSKTAFSNRLQRARKHFLVEWMGPDETPRRVALKSNAEQDEAGVCGSGHSRAEHAQRNKNGHWVCRPCRRAADRRRRAKETRVMAMVERSLEEAS